MNPVWPPPDHLLTVGEYAALSEDETGRFELLEGNLVRSPSPSPDHRVAPDAEVAGGTFTPADPLHITLNLEDLR